jgi:alpha-1,3-mannosylglycoprotein beta-1,4-N-acetylglucosaminyltransferase A/B
MLRPGNTSYLERTLTGLLEQRAKGSQRLSPGSIHILVVVTERNEFGTQTIFKSLTNKFDDAIQAGDLEIIQVSRAFYPPDLDDMSPSLNDSKERTVWRTKQNLDYAYSMMFARSTAEYYLQLEDDVSSRNNWDLSVLSFIGAQNRHQPQWFMLEFSDLGFIGKLFRTADLPFLISTLIMYHRDKPCDWLLDAVFYWRFCLPVYVERDCSKRKFNHLFRHKPFLFTHIGKVSSAPKNEV